MNKIFLTFIVILFTILIFFGYLNRNKNLNNYNIVCQLVSQKIYLNRESILNWRNQCLNRGDLVGHHLTVSEMIQELRTQFSYFQTSHLDIYDEQEVSQIWKGHSFETGIESQFVDGDLIILNILSQSPASKLSLKRGDIIVQINGEHPNPSLARFGKGQYLIRRLHKEFILNIQPGSVLYDHSPKIISLNEKTAHLKIPSFRKEFFNHGEWKKKVQILKKYSKIILDLRGNNGGNIVAGLRFLSPFICSATQVGQLLRPRIMSNIEKSLLNNLDDSQQIKALESSSSVQLSVFNEYGCINSKVIIIVDSRTASTGELVTQVLKEKLKIQVMGERTSGQLLIGIWYPLDFIKKGLQLSIPEAVFVSDKGYIIESNGIAPDRLLYYDKISLQQGKDSWVYEAVDL